MQNPVSPATPFPRRASTCRTILLLLTAPLTQASANQLIQYTLPPGSVSSTSYSVTVNGTPVPAEKFGDVSYVRFAFTGSADLVVTLPSNIATAAISPLSYNIAKTISGRTLSFSISEPRTLSIPVTLASGAIVEKLLVLADGPEINPPSPTGSGVVNFASYLSPGRNQTVAVTTELNTAISDVSAAGGGILYIPSGLYMSTQVTLKSNVSLYLESGALLRAIVGIQNTSGYPAQNNLSDSSFIYVGGTSTVDNVKIFGRGIIDCNGYAMRTANSTANIKLIRTKSATNFVLQDVLLRDACRWTVHLLYSDNLTVRNVKIVNNLLSASGQFTYPDPPAGGLVPLVSNMDGIDPDSSTFVTIDGCFVYTGDDSTSPKVTAYMGVLKECHDLVIKNNVLIGRGAGMRVGTEVRKNIYNILFDNNDVVSGKYFLRLAHDSSPSVATKIYNVNVNNNRTEYIGNGGFFNHATRPSTGAAVNPNFYLGTVCSSSNPSYVNGLYAYSRAVKYSNMDGYNNPAYPDKAGLTYMPVANFHVKNMYVAGIPIDGYDGQTGTSPNKTPASLTDVDTASVTITAPGSLPTVEVAATDNWSKEGSASGATEDTGTFTLSRMGSLTSALTVYYTVNGTASSGADYTALPGSVTIPAGASQARVTVSPKGDAISPEADEAVNLNLSANASYTVGALSSDTVTIANASGSGGGSLPVVSVLLQDGSSAESNVVPHPNPGKFKLVRAAATSSPLTVYFALTGSATEGADYPNLPHSATIPAGATSVIVQIDPAAEGGPEPIENVILTLSPNAAYTVGSPSSATLTIAAN